MNRLLVFDGKQWADQTPQTFDGEQWRDTAPLYWDGSAWMSSAPSPSRYPAFIAGTSGTAGAADVAALPVPASARTNDLVVSLCVQQSGLPHEPQLLAPAGVLSTRYTLHESGLRLHVAIWPWEPQRGTRAVWAVPSSKNSAVANLVYRYAAIEDLSLTPVDSFTEHRAVTEVPLPTAEEHTVLYAALTVSPNLTGAVWPEGVTGRVQQLGVFGEHHVSLVTADTPGGMPAPGNLRLDATVDVACAMITIPGRFDGQPTWVLGDPDSSVLGQTTHLG